MIYMLFGKRIKQLRLEHEWTQEYVCERLNISPGALSRYETGMYEPKSLALIKDFADLFDVSTDYLLGKSETRNPKNIFYMCPVYSQISASQPNWAEENIEGRIPLNTNLMHIKNPEEYFFLHINDEGMNKIVKDGSFALMHKQDIIENGEIALVLVDASNAILRKFTKQGDLIILEPQSNNENFETQVYDKNTSIKILGKYVGKMEINK